MAVLESGKVEYVVNKTHDSQRPINQPAAVSRTQTHMT